VGARNLITAAALTSRTFFFAAAAAADYPITAYMISYNVMLGARTYIICICAYVYCALHKECVMGMHYAYYNVYNIITSRAASEFPPPPPCSDCYRRNAISSERAGAIRREKRNVINTTRYCYRGRGIVRCLNDDGDDRKAKTLRRRRGVGELLYLPRRSPPLRLPAASRSVRHYNIIASRLWYYYIVILCRYIRVRPFRGACACAWRGAGGAVRVTRIINAVARRGPSFVQIARVRIEEVIIKIEWWWRIRRRFCDTDTLPTSYFIIIIIIIMTRVPWFWRR